MKAFCVFLLSILLSSMAFASANSTMARFLKEDAEAAFQKNDIEKTIAKLNEAERLLGKANAPILHLRIMARGTQLTNGPVLHETYRSFKADTEKFRKLLDTDRDLTDLAREVHRMTQKVDAIQEREVSAAKAILQQAEADDMDAINAVIARYSVGVGVPKDSAKVKYWQGRLAAAELKQDVAAAESGNVEALEKMAQRYVAGNGVKRDPTQAEAMLARAGQLRVQQQEEQARQAAEVARLRREREKQIELASIDYLENTTAAMDESFNIMDEVGPIAMFSTPVSTVGGVLMDIVSTPIKLTQAQMLKRELTPRAAAWGSPDSLMGRVFSAGQSGDTTP